MTTLKTGSIPNFSGLGSRVKLAFSLNPISAIKAGWANHAEGAHYLTPEHLRGWVGNSNIGRHLPVGMKSLMVAGTAAAVPGAVQKVDPEGHNKSRSERIGALAGATIGGIAGTLSHKAGLAKGIGATIGGTIAGHYIGSKVGKGVNAATGGN